MKNILVIGGGVSGKAAALLAEALDCACRITSDAEAASENMDELFSGVDTVIVSPGVLPTSQLYQTAKAKNLPVISELEFGVRYFPGKLLAVTGTNGKTTTVELTEFILKELGLQVTAAGNIGLPLSEVSAARIRSGAEKSTDLLAVLEVSSFQLEHTYYLPLCAAVLLNVESDHIDRYPGGLAEYRAVKERIFRNVPPGKAFYGCSMTGVKRCGDFFIEQDFLCYKKQQVLDLRESALSAAHNQENLLAALALCSSVTDLDSRIDELVSAVRKFKTGDHRISLVGEYKGVKYIDDSKATNPSAVLAAVSALQGQTPGKIVLIAGGLDKAMDFSSLRSIHGSLRKLIVYGECGYAVAQAFAGEDVEIFDAKKDFALAVKCAAVAAQAGDTVLLSPAAASMDMFKNYKERGDVFARLVKAEFAE